MSLSTIEYLKKSGMSAIECLTSTCDDYQFLKAGNCKTIIINGGDPNEEEISKYTILNRIRQLARICIMEGTLSKMAIDIINKTILIPEKLEPLKKDGL